MNFFKSVFSDEPDPPKSGSESYEEAPVKDEGHDSDPVADSSPTAGGWSFGGLIKTISAKSESVIETYRRDLQEFGSGLKKEIEVAHGSLETVGHRFDEIGTSVLKGTAQIIAQGKDAILATDQESDSDNNSNPNYSAQRSSNSKPYSRFDSQVRSIQGDMATYCEEIEDLDDYNKWKSQILLEDRSEEIEDLLEENAAMDNIYQKVVPNIVNNEVFWYRYFYRVHKLKQAEDVRANLVKRAMLTEEEDELSWDVYDEEEEYNEVNAGSKEAVVKNKEKSDENVGEKMKLGEKRNPGEETNVALKNDSMENMEEDGWETDEVVKEDVSVKKLGSSGGDVDNLNKNDGNDDDGDKETDQKVHLEGVSELNNKNQVSISDEKAGLEGKSDHGESCKDSDVSIISTQPSMPEEEELGWDELEDLSCIDDKKATQGRITNREETLKRLSASEEDKDLIWDIEDEDDDKPAKA